MQKEKRDYDGLMLISLLVGVALGVIITVAIGAILTYESGLVPSFFGAKWWEVFTAFGTVGAVITALLFGMREVILLKENKRIEEGMLKALIYQECIDVLKRSEGVKLMLKQDLGFTLGNMLLCEHARAYANRPALKNTNKLFRRIKSLGYERATAIARIISSWALLLQSINKAAVENETGSSNDLVAHGKQSALIHIKEIQEDVAVALEMSDSDIQALLEESINIGLKKTPRMKTIEDRIRDAGFTNPFHS